MKKFVLLVALGLGALALAACEPAADVASRNVSKAADNFEVARRISFINGITDNYLYVVEGFCSMGNYDSQRQLSVTCKTGEGQFVKHFLGLSDNVTFVTEQLRGVRASEFHHRTYFRPQSIIPDVDFQFSREELTTDLN